MLDIVILTLATVLILFLPGFVWSFVFFDLNKTGGSDKGPLEVSERIMWSFVLSLAIVPLSFFIMNSIVAFPVNVYSVTGLMMLLCFIGAVVYRIARKVRG